MNKVVLASALALATASASFAGGYEEPIIDAPVVVEEAPSSAVGSMGTTALVLLGAIALAVAIDSDSSDDT